MLSEEEKLSLQSEFGDGELCRRLVRAELRVGDCYVIGDWRKLIDELGAGLEFSEQNVTNIVSDLEKVWQDEARLLRALKPWEIDENVEDDQKEHGLSLGLQSLGRDTLARAFLHVEALQPGVVRCLVQKIPEFAEAGLSSAQTRVCAHDIPRLALRQLKWMDFVVDGAALCEIMLSVVSVCPPDLQRDIIETIPGIVDDANRDVAVNELLSIIQNSPSLMASVLDALAALGVAPNRLEHVNQVVLNTLAAVDQDTLPATLRYLLKATPPNSLDQLVKALRDNLALTSVGTAAGRLCMDTLRVAFRQRRDLAEAAFKKLRSIIDPKDFKPSDLWIILALMDCPGHRRSAESLFKRKAAEGFLRPWLIEAAVIPFAEGLTEVSSHMIALASFMIKAAEHGARCLGVAMYKIVFQAFPEGSVRRDVVVALLEHTGSKRTLEIDSSLDALVAIALGTERERSLIPYCAAIQTLFDFLELYSDSQLRKIWSIFGILCRSYSVIKGNASLDCESLDDGHSELAMLDIIIRKELTHTNPIYRRIGIIGACTLIKVLGTKNNTILPLLFENVKKCPWSEALAYDELARALTQKDDHRVSKNAVDTILATIAQEFETRFTQDFDSHSLEKSDDTPPASGSSSDAEGSELWMCLDGDTVELEIPIMNYVMGSELRNPDTLQVMIPNLRLLWSLTAFKMKGELGDIDALLGCPIRLPPRRVVQSFGSLSPVAKRQVLLALFVGYNWIAELLNGFSRQSNVELLSKCLERLQNLIELREMISACVAQFPSWREALYDANHHMPERSKSFLNASTESIAMHRQASKSNKQGGSSSTSWSELGRQLSFDTLSLLSIVDPISVPVYDQTEAEEPSEIRKVVLRPAGLAFFLRQVASYIGMCLRSQGKSKTNEENCVLVQGSGPINDLPEFSTSLSSLDLLLHLKPCLLVLTKQLRRCLMHLQLVASSQECCDDNPEDAEIWQECMLLCLRCYAGALSAPAIQHDLPARDLLFEILKSTDFIHDTPAVHKSDPLTEIHIGIAAKRAFEQLRRTIGASFVSSHHKGQIDQEMMGDSSITFEGYSLYLASLNAIVKFAGAADRKRLRLKLSDSAGSILEHDWNRTTMKLSRTVSVLPQVLGIHIRASSDPMECMNRIMDMLNIFREQRKQVDSGGSQESAAAKDRGCVWGTIKENTFHIFLKVLLQECCRMFRSLELGSFEDPSSAFMYLTNLVSGTYKLYTTARSSEKVLAVAMRNGRIIVDSFTRRVMPYFKDKFRDCREDILKILKVQQKTTRLLQTFCSHGKAVRNSALTSIVPSLRKALELLLYRVKEMMQAQRAGKAFCLGNLKHRDITGAVVASQLQYQSDSSVYLDTDTEEDEDKSSGQGMDGIEEDLSSTKRQTQSYLQEGRSDIKAAKKRVQKEVFNSAKKKKRRSSLSVLELFDDKENDANRTNSTGRWKKPRSAQSKTSKKVVSRNTKGAYLGTTLVETEATEVVVSESEEDSNDTDLDGFIVGDDEPVEGS